MGNTGGCVSCRCLLSERTVKRRAHGNAIPATLADAYAGGRAYACFYASLFPGYDIACARAVAQALADADVLGYVQRTRIVYTRGFQRASNGQQMRSQRRCIGYQIGIRNACHGNRVCVPRERNSKPTVKLTEMRRQSTWLLKDMQWATTEQQAGMQCKPKAKASHAHPTAMHWTPTAAPGHASETECESSGCAL